MLAVARRFAIAYMPYQVGRLPPWARTAIYRTCTPAFARYLLAQPAQPTPLQAAHPNAIESYRVASVEPAGAPDTVAVSHVSAQDSADTGEFALTSAGPCRDVVLAGLGRRQPGGSLGGGEADQPRDRGRAPGAGDPCTRRAL